MMPKRLCLGPSLVVLLCSTAVLSSRIKSSNETLQDKQDETLEPFLHRLQAGPDHYTNADRVLFGIVILIGFEILQFLTYNIGSWVGVKEIPVRGKHLDELGLLDRAFIAFNKVSSVPYVYLLVRYCYTADNVVWTKPSLGNVLLPLPGFLVIYDFFYVILHGGLHLKAVYGWIHKHHHHQKAPSRGNTDAVNVHPVEFVLGEYNHLLAVYLYNRCFPIHPLSCLLFMIAGGLMTGFNHTRHDMVFEMFGIKLFDTKAHDVHHRIPQSNYGQYTMLWDYFLGSYRPYNKDDRVNPKYQLDGKSGKSILFMEEQAKLKEKSQ